VISIFCKKLSVGAVFRSFLVGSFVSVNACASAQDTSIVSPSPIVADAYQPITLDVMRGCLTQIRKTQRVAVLAGRIDLRLISGAGDDDFNCIGGTNTVQLPPLSAGTYQLFGFDPETSQYRFTQKVVQVNAAPPTVPIFSMAFAGFDIPAPKLRYFVTQNAADVPALLAINANITINPIWRVADAGFKAWPAAGPAPAAALPVCRFFSPAISSHFYSIRPEDCALLRSLPALWTDEGIAFRILPAAGGVCGFGTQTVYRLYSSEHKNHRYTTEVETYRSMQFEGWSGEGAAFCAPVD
jgi:Repeat of unknown function (DUF5648)